MISKKSGIWKPFPEGKTLTEMMQDPIGFNNWWKENIG